VKTRPANHGIFIPNTLFQPHLYGTNYLLNLAKQYTIITPNARKITRAFSGTDCMFHTESQIGRYPLMAKERMIQKRQESN
jgi:hypothetical protein